MVAGVLAVGSVLLYPCANSRVISTLSLVRYDRPSLVNSSVCFGLSLLAMMGS